MKLSPSQIKILHEKLPSLLKQGCASCSVKQFQASNEIFELREFNGGGLILDNDQSLIPMIILICKRCGHMHFFNAIVLGVLTPEQENTP